MKKHIDFLQRARLSIIINNGLGRPANLFSTLSFSPWKNAFPFKILLLLAVLPCSFNLALGQVDSVAITTTVNSEICEKVTLSVSATTFTNGTANSGTNARPFIWSARSTNNVIHKSTFSLPEAATTDYTPSDVTGSRTDQIIATIDAGYPVIWIAPITGIDTSGGKFVCEIAGEGNSGAQSSYVLASNTDGWVETKMTGSVRAAIGLSSRLNNNNPSSLNYGIEFNSLNQAFVIENDTTRTSPITYATGDIFRVERIGSTIVYKQDRSIFYTSTIPSSAELVADASMAVVDQTLDITVNFGDPNYVFPADTITVQVLEGVKLDIGPDLEICEDDSVTLSLSISEASFQGWSVTGNTGTFNTSSLVYTPTTPLTALSRIDEVTALTFGATNGICPAAKDTVKITVRQAPKIAITTITNPAICEEDSITLTATPSENADTIFWTTNNGTFNIANGITNTTLDDIKYKPSEGQTTAIRNDKIYLMSDSDFPVCPAALDTIDITVNWRGAVNNTFSRANLCSGDSIELDAVLSRGATDLLWSIKTGSGIFSPTAADETNTVYQPTGAIDSVRYDTLLVKTSGTLSCEEFVDTVIVSVFELDAISNSFATFDICEGDSVKLDATLAGATVAIKWTSKDGNGTFLDPDSKDATYIPIDISTNELVRNDSIFITTIPTSSCVAAIDTVVINVHKVAQLSLSSDTTMCVTETTFLKSTNRALSIDNVIRWDTLLNGTSSELTDQTTSDSVLYKYQTTVPIQFPNLSRQDTIIATTATPSFTANGKNRQTCLAAIDTVVVTLIDTANVSVVATSIALCEKDTTPVDMLKAAIHTGATSVTWKILPKHISRGGIFIPVDSVATRYIPGNITDNTTATRIDTLMAISNGLTGCQPDTAYVEIIISNGVTLSPVTDKVLCNGDSINLTTTLSGLGSFGGWEVISNTNQGNFSAKTSTITNYNSVALTTQTSARVDSIKYTATSTDGLCPTFRDSFRILINPNHIVNITDIAGQVNTDIDTITVCEGSSTPAIAATIGNGTTTVLWTSKSGSFNNPTSLTPIYTPTTGLTTNVRYDTLILSSTNSQATCTVARDSIIIEVQRAAALSTATGSAVCESEMVTLSALSTGFGDSVFWELVNNAAGEFSNTQKIDTTKSGATTVVYQPTLDVTAQFRIDTIRYSSEKPLGVCPVVKDTILVYVFNTPTVEVDDPTKAKDSLFVCEGIGLPLDGSYGGGAIGATWSVLNNAGVLSGITNDTIGIYTPNEGVTNTTRVDTLVLTSTVVAGTCTDLLARDTLFVIVQKGPVVTVVMDSLTLCEGNTIDIAGNFGSIATGFTWSTKVVGSGNIQILTDTTARYTPTGIIDQPGRLDVLYLTSTNGNATCLTAVDSIEIFVSAKPTLELGADVSMCGNLTQVLTPQSNGLSNRLTWTSTDGTFATNPSPTGLYQPTFPIPTISRNDGIIVTSIDSLELCTAVVDTMLVTVYGLARIAIGDQATICEDDSLVINPAFGGTSNDFTYTVTNNAGIVRVDNNQLFYTPNENSTQNDRVDEVIIDLGDVDGTGACPALMDTIDVTVLNTPRAILVGDTTICEGQQVNLLTETFGLIDTFKSTFSTSLVNYPSTPPTLVNEILKDTIIYGTKLVNAACPAVVNQTIVTIQELGNIDLNLLDTTICEANSLVLNAGLLNPTGFNYDWQIRNNHGTFDDATIATPTYTPNTGLTANVVDTIILKTVDKTNICNVGLDTMLITIIPSATLANLRDTTICEGEMLNLSANLMGTATFFWSSNSGTFGDTAMAQTTYTHAPVNGTNGVDIIAAMIAFPDNTCLAAQKTMKVTVIGQSTVFAGLDTTVCTGIDVQLAGTLGIGIDSAEWTVLNNAGTFDTTKSLTAIYTPTPNIGTTDRIDQVILNTFSTLSCAKPLDTILITVKPIPTVNLGADQQYTGTPDVTLTAQTSTEVKVGQWRSKNGIFPTTPAINQTVYRANPIALGENRLDTIIYTADFGVAGCQFISDTIVVTYESPELIIRDTNTAFCQSVCIDTSGVNIDRNTGQYVVLAADINPFDTCLVRSDLSLKFWYPALGIPEPLSVLDFPALPDSIIFDCEDRGLQNVNVYVATDPLNVQLCPAVIEVVDAFITCGEKIVSGRITNFQGAPIEGFSVFIENIDVVGGVVPPPVLTDADGRYEFQVDANRKYRVTPVNNEDSSEGVTSFDNVIISRHILGLQVFDSPFQTIAADVNKSGTVTAFDIVLIRKIVLSQEATFQNNTSWRFVDADYEFTDIGTAAAAPFMENFEVPVNTGNIFDMDFIAVKIGDVSRVATSGLVATAASRNDHTAITFETTNLLKTHFGTTFTEKGLLTTCWSSPNPVAQEKEWFTLQFKATKNGRLSELLSINSAITPIEAYTTENANIGIELTFKQPVAATFDLFQNKPNPFKNETVIGFALPSASKAKITILDMQGRTLHVIEGDYAIGYNEIVIDRTDLPRGVFYYHLETAFGTKVQKMMHIE